LQLKLGTLIGVSLLRQAKITKHGLIQGPGHREGWRIWNGQSISSPRKVVS